MQDTHAILCFGKTLPGYDSLSVRRAVQHSFKCSEAEMNEMFSGAEVRLREALSAEEAELWRQQLHGLGLKVMIDPPPRPPAPAGPDGDDAAPHPGARRAAPAAAGSPPVFGLDFQGRLGREAYLKAVCCTFMVAGVLVPASLTLSAERWGGPTMALALGLTLLFTGFCMLRSTWLRSHDVGLSGKWALLPPLACLPIAALPFGGLDPLAGALSPADQALSGLGLAIAFTLTLLAWPGQEADNHWGPPPSRVNAVPALLGALAIAGAYAALIVFGLKLLPR